MSATATITDRDIVQIPAAMLPALRRAVARDRAPADAVHLLRQVGYEAGQAVYDGVMSRAAEGGIATPDALAPDQFWSGASAYFESLGWGSLRQEQVHPALGALDLTDWIEASSDGGEVPPGCHLTTGIVADLLGRVAGAEVSVMEVPTASASCRLLFGGQEALGRVYQALVEGLTSDEAVARLG